MYPNTALTENPISACRNPDDLSEDAADAFFARCAMGAQSNDETSELQPPIAPASKRLGPAPRPHNRLPILAAAVTRRQTDSTQPRLPRGTLPAGIRYRAEIMRAAQAHGIDPIILAALAAQETGGPGAHSGRNVVGYDGTGHGVFQIDSGTWSSWLAGHHDGMDVGENADKAAQILADNLRATGGNLARALHRYNAGSDGAPCTRTTWADGTSHTYEDSVLIHAAQIRALQ